MSSPLRLPCPAPAGSVEEASVFRTEDLGLVIDLRSTPGARSEADSLGEVALVPWTDLPADSGYQAWTDLRSVGQWENPNGDRFTVLFDASGISDLFDDTLASLLSLIETFLPLLFLQQRPVGADDRHRRDLLIENLPKIEDLFLRYEQRATEARHPVPRIEIAIRVPLLAVGITSDQEDLTSWAVDRYGTAAGWWLTQWQMHGISPADARGYADSIDFPLTEHALLFDDGPLGLDYLIEWLDGSHPPLIGLPKTAVSDFFVGLVLRWQTHWTQPWSPEQIRRAWDLGIRKAEWLRIFAEQWTQDYPDADIHEQQFADIPDTSTGTGADPWVESPPTLLEYLHGWAQAMPLQEAVWYAADGMEQAEAIARHTHEGFDPAAFEVLWELQRTRSRRALVTAPELDRQPLVSPDPAGRTRAPRFTTSHDRLTYRPELWPSRLRWLVGT